MELSEILVRERKQKGETQQQVADMLYITRQSLSNWETGKNFPDIPMLIKLSTYYDFSLDMMKEDEQLMKQVEKDYDLINQKKANKKYSVLLSVLLGIIILCSILLPLTDNHKLLMKSGIILIVLVSVILLHVAVRFSKIAYQHYEFVPDAPLWVPKSFGYGVTINPYHKVGKVITVVMLVGLDILFVGIAIATLFFS